MMRSGGSSLQTMLPVPDTSKSCKLHPSISNWNYSGLAWVGSARLCPIVIKAISASRQSWSLGLAELSNSTEKSLNKCFFSPSGPMVARKTNFPLLGYDNSRYLEIS